MKKTYIFILCPPFQGSTLLVNLLDSSKITSTFSKVAPNTGESQWLLPVHGDNHYMNNRWNPTYDLNMNRIQFLFKRYLDDTKQIYVDKSPPMICRAIEYQEYFKKLGNVLFIISIRSPYSTNDEANKWVQYASYQKKNIEILENTIITNYEEICSNLDHLIKKIQNKLPELEDISNIYNKNLTGERGTMIHDKKLTRIIDKEKKNNILKNNLELLHYFGYKLIH